MVYLDQSLPQAPSFLNIPGCGSFVEQRLCDDPDVSNSKRAIHAVHSHYDSPVGGWLVGLDRTIENVIVDGVKGVEPA
ncbi:hypothetical protein [Novosphingobium sp. AP12]|uniref:hypothetical protein n=1 Tax=Novosphingobium sp. AP12 TaxID=1144305 RepID=UPI0012F802A0|nr:hypothetical protein [Novosphingobium sp. AP12]